MCNITRNPRTFYTMLTKFYNPANQEISISNLILHRNRYVERILSSRATSLLIFTLIAIIFTSPFYWTFFGGKNPSLNKPFSLQEVERTIRKSRNSTPGADGIPANWFKKLNYADIFKITSIFQDIFSTSCPDST
ncbi:hypothetical protein AVEN_245320-1 [Araneus ventricosus]|uniref:Uncharacterized protein n=1 Tax=Araneus ventricosus TaxID=182803 RepID=A0A4Y2KEC4_ARAVE|nr:hypothetical protein AVEN_245320-1 [Araneus ventricosus]